MKIAVVGAGECFREKMTPDLERMLISWADPKYLFIMSTFYHLLQQEKPVHYMLENSETSVRITYDARNTVSRTFTYRRGEV